MHTCLHNGKADSSTSLVHNPAYTATIQLAEPIPRRQEQEDDLTDHNGYDEISDASEAETSDRVCTHDKLISVAQKLTDTDCHSGEDQLSASEDCQPTNSVGIIIIMSY